MKNLMSDTPIARNTDPVSSHLAAEHVVKTGSRAHQQQIAYNAVVTHPGCTSLELSKRCELDRYQLARRLSEIAGKYVQKGHMRQCTVSGRMAVTWLPKQKKGGGDEPEDVRTR
jgi:hypothetical protein